MPSYSAAKAAIDQVQARESTMQLQHPGNRSLFLIKPHPTKLVFLLFHGFTAAPYQFIPLGTALHRAGYNVIAPLMPGHGLAGNWGRNNPPPLPTDPKPYYDFANYWLEQAQGLGTQVVVGGLSGGGTLAAWLALERPTQIYRTVLYAAYLSGSNRVIDLFTQSTNMYYSWALKPGEACPGYSGFSTPALRVLLNMGQDLLNRAKKSPVAPLFVISSESDRAVDNYDHEALFQSALKRQPKCWHHCFDRVLDIPHTMMTQQEGNRYENLLIAMTKAYAESDLSWAEVEEIGYRMTQGKAFPVVVNELKLTQKASRDMPTMMTMVDKRAIAIKRNPSMRD